MSDINLQLNDFKFWGTWTEDKEGPKCKFDPNVSEFVIDDSTGRYYWNQSDGCLRMKSLLLLIPLAPIGHAVTMPFNVALRALRFITFYHLWKPSEKGEGYNLLGRLKSVGGDFLRVILAPLAYLGLIFASLWIWFSPKNGAKLYNTIERAEYGTKFVWAPCLSPDPKKHFFSGKTPGNPNAF